jgi:hypothetical protein
MQAMSLFLDARIPVVFVADPSEVGPDDALLLEGERPVPEGVALARFVVGGEHAPACACCTGRSAAARALSELFLARARGQGAYFKRVCVVCASVEGREAVAAALTLDVLASGWFRAGQ